MDIPNCKSDQNVKNGVLEILEGDFYRKGCYQERFITITSNRFLHWRKAPLGKILGSLDLQPNVKICKSDTDAANFSLKAGNTEIHFKAKSPLDAAVWQMAIRTIIMEPRNSFRLDRNGAYLPDMPSDFGELDDVIDSETFERSDVNLYGIPSEGQPECGDWNYQTRSRALSNFTIEAFQLLESETFRSRLESTVSQCSSIGSFTAWDVLRVSVSSSVPACPSTPPPILLRLQSFGGASLGQESPLPMIHHHSFGGATFEQEAESPTPELPDPTLRQTDFYKKWIEIRAQANKNVHNDKLVE